uniref:Reverse transcriptase Ty1/copia-type domain-containing protein n=1 Tax=Tanacetum cinerariifolium TaxID=118510 RepID=A0A6L2K587_TANCI|nr:hypothetical protein [Tanacetum cinerariifolium]
MDSLSPQVVSAAKLLILNPNEFDLWKMRIEQYFLMTDYSLWEVILNGDSPAPTRVVKEDVNLKFLRSLLSEWKTHTLIWRNKADLEEQSLDDLFNRLKIYEAEINHSSSTGTTTQNLAFVSSSNTNSTTESVSAASSVSAICANMHVSSLPNVDSLRNAVIYSFFASQSSSPQLDNKDLKQIDVDDLKEMDLKWQMAMLTMRARREYRSPKDSRRNGAAESQRRTVPVETFTSNALVSQCDGVRSYDWSFQADEEPAIYALMAFSSSSTSSDNEVVSCSKACFKAYAQLHSQYDKLTANFCKSQFDVISYQTGLESVEARLLVYKQNESVFEEDIKLLKLESDESWPPSSLYDRFQPSDGYHAVPPPYPRTFMPPKPDLVFNTAPTAVETNHSAFNTKAPQIVPSFFQSTEQVKSPRLFVLTQSKPVPITAVRPVSTVVPKFKVPRPRHAKPIVTKSNSPTRRHITRSPSPKASNSTPRVTAVKAPVVNAAQGMRGKWEWRTKCPILDHVSRNTSASMTLKRFDYTDALGRSNDRDAAFDGKEPEFDEKKPESAVNVSPRSSAQSKKQDDKTKKEAKGKSPVESFTGYRDLSAEFEDYSKDSINEGNAAELEDITYSNDEDDVGAEANFNNLKKSIIVTHIPTTRVHKDHPVTSLEELIQFKMQKVWILVDFPFGKRAIGFEDPDNPDKIYKVVKIYVDDIIFGATNKDLCKSFKKLMKDKFQMSLMGELTFFLGLQVKPKNDGIFISQDKYVAEIIRKFGLTEGKSASTPIDTEKPLLKDPDGKGVDVHTYRLMIGSLMYLTSSRPDIMFAV